MTNKIFIFACHLGGLWCKLAVVAPNLEEARGAMREKSAILLQEIDLDGPSRVIIQARIEGSEHELVRKKIRGANNE